VLNVKKFIENTFYYLGYPALWAFNAWMLVAWKWCGDGKATREERPWYKKLIGNVLMFLLLIIGLPFAPFFFVYMAMD
jgi:hypothetical protein